MNAEFSHPNPERAEAAASVEITRMVEAVRGILSDEDIDYYRTEHRDPEDLLAAFYGALLEKGYDPDEVLASGGVLEGDQPE